MPAAARNAAIAPPPLGCYNSHLLTTPSLRECHTGVRDGMGWSGECSGYDSASGGGGHMSGWVRMEGRIFCEKDLKRLPGMNV